MKQLVPILARYYDHVIIDCPAGIGKGFISAVAAANRALVIVHLTLFVFETVTKSVNY